MIVHFFNQVDRSLIQPFIQGATSAFIAFSVLLGIYQIQQGCRGKDALKSMAS